MVQSTLDGVLKKKNLEKGTAKKVKVKKVKAKKEKSSTLTKTKTKKEEKTKKLALLHEYLKWMDNFKIDRIISTFKAQLLVQEQTEQEVDDKISIASKSTCAPKATVTQVYSLILIIIAQI